MLGLEGRIEHDNPSETILDRLVWRRCTARDSNFELSARQLPQYIVGQELICSNVTRDSAVRDGVVGRDALGGVDVETRDAAHLGGAERPERAG